ncbi:hypothetical protein [Isoptericola croceus]|uniref:hypothetical protein n=1 Tax=Isoptericola croceus TaxID=3031406 RepID=UPI0023FA2811|nr:hypothetical protein [Isoptericola croceus]
MSRGWPDLAPVECRTSEGTSSALSCTRPHVHEASTRSAGGSSTGPAARNARVRVNGATTARAS